VGGGILRLILAAVVSPSVDESYAITMSRRLEPSYYDHPPMMFWLTAAATRLGGNEHRFTARLPFILAFAVTTALVYLLGARLFGRSAGLWAAASLNLALFFAVGAGGWVLPDGPLLLAAASATLCLAKALFENPKEAPAPWYSFGVFTGLALLSKYHGILLLAGAGLFLVTSARHRFWLRRPAPYLSAAIALAVFSPVLFWNATHGWASFRFQAARGVAPPDAEGTPFLGSLGGQASWMLPWIWVPLIMVLVGALRAGPRDAKRWLLACLASGPIFGFTLLTALGTSGLPHWTAPGYFFLFLLLGAELAGRVREGSAWPRRWLAGSAAGLIIVVGVLATQANTGWLGRIAPGLVRMRDPTIDLVPWDGLVPRLASLGQPAPGVVIAGTIWSDTAKIAYTLGPKVAVACVGEDPRGFHYVTDQSALLGRDVLLVVRRRPGPETMVAYAPFFERVIPLGMFPASPSRDEPILSFYLGRRFRAPVPPIRPL
jgi:4-amino-4-deoxy-L-arabinose transferase-like glycosyltransferase